jgi:hypothetical protein
MAATLIRTHYGPPTHIHYSRGYCTHAKSRVFQPWDGKVSFRSKGIISTQDLEFSPPNTLSWFDINDYFLVG